MEKKIKREFNNSYYSTSDSLEDSEPSEESLTSPTHSSAAVQSAIVRGDITALALKDLPPDDGTVPEIVIEKKIRKGNKSVWI